MEILEGKELEATIDEFQRKLERLRVLYEQYFMGIEKREPLVVRKDVVRVMRLLEQQTIRNTSYRFRFRNLVQKFNVYKTYWSRTLRRIEAGTYHRDVARLNRRLRQQGAELEGDLQHAGALENAIRQAAQKQRRSAAEIRGKPAERLGDVPPAVGLESLAEGDRDFEGIETNVVTPALESPARQRQTSTPDDAPTAEQPMVRRPQRTARRPAAAPAPPAASSASSGELDDAKIRSLYRRLQKAKRMCGEDPGSVQLDSLAQSLRRQLPRLQQMHAGRQIEFQVVIREGKAVVKAKAT